MKTCYKCNIEKPLDGFYARHAQCKECAIASVAAQKAARRLAQDDVENLDAYQWDFEALQKLPLGNCTVRVFQADKRFQAIITQGRQILFECTSQTKDVVGQRLNSWANRNRERIFA